MKQSTNAAATALLANTQNPAKMHLQRKAIARDGVGQYPFVENVGGDAADPPPYLSSSSRIFDSIRKNSPAKGANIKVDDNTTAPRINRPNLFISSIKNKGGDIKVPDIPVVSSSESIASKRQPSARLKPTELSNESSNANRESEANNSTWYKRSQAFQNIFAPNKRPENKMHSSIPADVIDVRRTKSTLTNSYAASQGASLSKNISQKPNIARLSQVQTQAMLSLPSDPAETEARAVAKSVMMTSPAAWSPQREAPAMRNTVHVPRLTSGGFPLSTRTRGFMEPRLQQDLGHVRIHTGEQADRLCSNIRAKAFTVGSHIFFAKDQFQPNSQNGLELIAHELTHTFQQGTTIRRSEEADSGGVPFGLGWVLDLIAEKANVIPGFRMFTIILGKNPINMSDVDRSPSNILRAIVEFMPGGSLITDALNNYGIFDKVGGWIAKQLESLSYTAGSIKQAISRFINGIDLLNPPSPSEAWEQAKAIFTEPIDRIKEFVKNLAADVMKFIKEAIIVPLAQLASSKVEFWDLLVGVLGYNPITDEEVSASPEVLIGGFMKLIGQQEIWENMQKANAVDRAWKWFQGTMGSLVNFVSQIPGLAMKALEELQIEDVVLVVTAFEKIGRVFGGFVSDFTSWALDAMWKLLEIIFEVVKPGALDYVKRTGAAIKGILQDPMPFIGNLVKAAKLGFENFADHFLGHLKNGLISWLTDSLPGVYIPQALTLPEIVKLAFSVLGISWQLLRQKLVKMVGDNTVKAMEVAIPIVVTLVTEGPAAAWDKIKEELANLKDMVLGGIIDLVVDAVVQKAIPKLIGMFIPGAGFIPAIISIYDTVMVFVNKLSQIGQVVVGFINSIVAIASGDIGGAAGKVENILANILSLAINFLAGFAGLGKVADKVLQVVEKVRGLVDKGLDKLADWIVKMAKKLFAKLFDNKAEGQDPEKQTKIDNAIKVLRTEESKRTKGGMLSYIDAKEIASTIKSQNPIFTSFEAFEQNSHIKYRYTASPPIVIEGPEELSKHDVNESDIEAPETEPGEKSWEMTIFANVAGSKGKQRLSWVLISIPMDPELKIPTNPPSPNMLIEGRVTIDDEKRQLRLAGGSITEFALKLIISRYEARFGDLKEIHGSLAADNKSLYQMAYAELRSKGVEEDSARDQAILRTPFGKYRAKLKYNKFEIKLSQFEWASIPKLDRDPKKRFFVPTSINVIARR